MLLKRLEITEGINIQLLEDDNAQVFIRLDMSNIVMDTNFLPDEPTALKVIADMQKRLSPEQHKFDKARRDYEIQKHLNMFLKNKVLKKQLEIKDGKKKKNKKGKK